MKLILVIVKLVDDIGSVDVNSVSKCIKGGFGVIVCGNVGWDTGRNVGVSVDIEVIGEVGIGDYGGK